jgi:hypothetical protein
VLPVVITVSHTEVGRLKVAGKARMKKGTITFGSEKVMEDQGGRIDSRYPATYTIKETKRWLFVNQAGDHARRTKNHEQFITTCN